MKVKIYNLSKGFRNKLYRGPFQFDFLTIGYFPGGELSQKRFTIVFMNFALTITSASKLK